MLIYARLFYSYVKFGIAYTRLFFALLSFATKLIPLTIRVESHDYYKYLLKHEYGTNTCSDKVILKLAFWINPFSSFN